MRNRLIALGALMLASSAFTGPTDAPAAPIVFFDIAGPDAARLRDFYSINFAWSIAASNRIKTGNLDGTLRQDPVEKIIYVGVPNLDSAMAKVTATGGKVVTPKLPTGTGEMFVLFLDPAGNRMGLVSPRK